MPACISRHSLCTHLWPRSEKGYLLFGLFARSLSLWRSLGSRLLLAQFDDLVQARPHWTWEGSSMFLEPPFLRY